MASFEKCTGYLITDDYQWFPVVYTGDIDVQVTPNIVDFVSALGQRSVFERGHQPREWSVSATAPWKWVRALKALGEARARRYYWYSPLGLHTNVLPDSRPRSGDYVGMREVDGYPVEVYTTTSKSLVSKVVPVKPGTTIYASGYATQGKIQVDFYDSTDTRVSTAGYTDTTGTLENIQTPAMTVPEGAVNAAVVAYGDNGPGLAGGFAMWLEDHSLPTGGGSECAYVTLHDVKVGHGNIAYEDSPVSVSFTLKEVG